MAFVDLTIVLFAFCGYLRADFSSDYCEIPEETCGPFIPQMPRSYVVKLESTEPLKNRTLYSIEYYDADHSRGTLISYIEGEESRIIYDVRANSLITVLGGRNDVFRECYVRSLVFDGENLIFGWRDSAGINSSYIHVGGALFHYLPQLRFQFVNLTKFTVRGMSANRWTGCIYLPQVDGTFKIDYYWSNNKPNDLQSSTPSGEKSVPLRTVIEGRYLPDPNKKDAYSDVYIINHVVWFQSSPNLSDEMFEPPRGVFCTNDVNKNPFPTFPQTFSVSVETHTDNRVENYELWYDLPMRLIRMDHWSSDNDIIYIHDYDTGVIYSIDKYSSNCTSSILSATKNPFPAVADIFSMNFDNFEYLGKYTVRDRLCDVWAGLLPDSISVSEWSFLDESWHQSQDDGTVVTRVPVQTIITNKDPSNSSNVVRHVKNYFNFVSDPTGFPFDIGSCFSPTERKLFQVAFPGDVQLNPRSFADSFRYVVSNVVRVSPLRVTDVQVDRDVKANRIFVEFIILSLLQGQITTSADVSLSDAVTNLKMALRDNGINVRVGLTEAEMRYVTALPDSYLELDIDDPCKSGGLPLVRKQRSVEVVNDDSNYVDKYSSGQLIGLGFGLFFLGLILGTLAMVLLLLRLKPEEPLISSASNNEDIQLDNSTEMDVIPGQ